MNRDDTARKYRGIDLLRGGWAVGKCPDPHSLQGCCDMPSTLYSEGLQKNMASSLTPQTYAHMLCQLSFASTVLHFLFFKNSCLIFFPNTLPEPTGFVLVLVKPKLSQKRPEDLRPSLLLSLQGSIWVLDMLCGRFGPNKGPYCDIPQM